MSAVRNAAPLLRRAERFRNANEVKHDQTRQRQFELRFESRDLPDSRAAIVNASDNGRGAAIIRACGDRDLNWYERRIQSAASSLPRHLWHLRGLLLNLYRYRGNRHEIKAKTWPNEDPESHAANEKYWRGVKKLLNFFERPVNIG